jgi:uncharacterized protein (TIGR04255 family)
MGKKLENAPVYFTIGQVSYNPILNLDSYLNPIQEKFRKAGYPGFKTLTSKTFNLGSGGIKDTEVPQFEQNRQYIFSNMDETSNFVLDGNALSFQVCNYDTFKEFSDSLFQALKIVNDAISLNFSQRVGLRYLDAIVPKKGETLEKYLIPEVLGFGSKSEENFVYSFSESRNKVREDITLLSRVIIQNGPFGVPPDLVGIKVGRKFLEISGMHATVDTDAFYKSRKLFNMSELKDDFNKLHNATSNAFKEITTDYAFSIWK